MRTKITTLATIFCLAILFVGCSKNDDDNSLSKSQVIGKWSVTEVWNNEDNKWISTSTLGSNYIYAQFNDNDTYSAKWGTDLYSGKYKISGKTIVCTHNDGYKEYYKMIELSGNNALIEWTTEDDPIPTKMKARK